MVTLDEDKHEYRVIGSGEVVPGVTSVLNELEDFRHVKAEVLEHARQLGTAVHVGVELHLQGRLDWSTVHELVKPRLEAAIKFLEHDKPEILFIERPVFHPLHKYAGKPDLGAALFGDRAIIDWKSGSFISPALVGPQTAAYKLAKNAELAREFKSVEEFTANCYRKRFAVQLREDGDYRLTECKDLADEAVFLSCLNIFRWRQKHGLRR